MVRPTRNQSRPRPIKKETNFSEDEWEQAKLAADSAGLPFQTFMRKAVLAQNIRPKKHRQAQNLIYELSKVMAELNRVGNNINQLAKQANQNSSVDNWGLEADLTELRVVVNHIAETIKKV